MVNQEVLETIAHAIMANSILLNHAYCILVRELNLDPQRLINELRSLPLPPEADKDFLTIYASSKDLLLLNLEAIMK